MKPVLSIHTLVTFAAPYISVLSGAVATWLFVHVHFFSIFHVTSNTVASAATQLVVFALTAVLTYAAAHFHWLPVVLTKLGAPGYERPKTLGAGADKPSRIR